jgi:hypothetical protein
LILILSQDRFDHMDDHTLNPKARDIHRIEVITGAGRRRRWPADVKARIVAESAKCLRRRWRAGTGYVRSNYSIGGGNCELGI